MFGLVARYDGKNIWRELEDGDEHQTSKTSAIFEHIQECAEASHLVERDKFTIVAKRLKHRDARKRFESIYIRYFDKKAHQTMNNCKSSRELVIF